MVCGLLLLVMWRARRRLPVVWLINLGQDWATQAEN
jgi:hypothetical protein